jgi:regulator of PEP synthase PpsR (kinase-PPPase family)
VWRAEVAEPEATRGRIEQDNVDARIRAERMAVRLKLASTAGAKTGVGRPSSAPSFDARIAEAEATNRSNKSKLIEEERAAVRARMGKFRMNRYAFVNTGANTGVFDRVTGEAAPVNDDAFAIEDRVDLARERVKQAQQELANAKAEAEAKERDLGERVAKLEKLAGELADKRQEENEGRDGGRGAERKAVLAAMKEMRVDGEAGGAAGPSTTAAGAGAKKIAVATSTPAAASPIESPEDAKARAADAIRARASSSLSRLRKHRKSRLSQASSLRKTPVTSTAAQEGNTVAEHDPLRAAAAISSASAAKESEEASCEGQNQQTAVIPANDVLPKPIFVLSDCTGESAANTCRAALGQFEELMNLSMPTNLYIFRFLNDGGDAYKIVQQAKEDDALVVYTLSVPEMVTSVMTACKLYGVRSVNLWGPLLESMEAHLMMTRIGVPMTERGASTVSRTHTSSEALSTDYYRMIEAVEFTRQMDDGARPDKWKDADILILGVSRTGKTPLSIYLGQRGYKVANLPLVPRNGQLMVPKYIDDVDPKRVFGLLINGEVLHDIRTNRLSSIGVKREDKSAMEYSTMRQVTQELSLAKALYARNPDWTVLDVTHKGVEETAARVMKIMYQSENANNYSLMKAT